jgi:hypothetical protein
MSSSTASPPSPFAAAMALQDEHGRAYAELADRIRLESPETASVLLTMRQRQAAQLRRLFCIYGLSSRPHRNVPSRKSGCTQGVLALQPTLAACGSGLEAYATFGAALFSPAWRNRGV